MDQEPKAVAGKAEAEAELDGIIAELGPEKARELFELALAELIIDQDPDNETEARSGR